jgi:hypothetical protein
MVVTWSVLMRSFDLSHLPLLLVSLIPLAAIVVGLVAGTDGPISLTHSADLTRTRRLPAHHARGGTGDRP